MSTGMKIYAAALLALVAVILGQWLWVPGDVRALNQQLAADDYLAAYPYTFRVLSLEGSEGSKTAVVSSPRSARMSVPQMIGAIVPELANASVTSEAFLNAQQELADHQAHAAALIQAAPGIQRIRWQLDRGWLQAHGIQVAE